MNLNPFKKPITVTIDREEYKELKVKEKSAEVLAKSLFSFWELHDELSEELESYKLTKKLLNLQARTDSHTIKVLEKVVKEREAQLQEKQEYCDYLELESNRTEQAFKIKYELGKEQRAKITDLNKELKALWANLTDTKKCLEHANMVNKANIIFMSNVRTENIKLGEKLQKANAEIDKYCDAMKQGTVALKKQKQELEELKVRLENSQSSTKKLFEMYCECENSLPKFEEAKHKITADKPTDEVKLAAIQPIFNYAVPSLQLGQKAIKEYVAKHCSNCKQLKPLDQFHKQAGKKGGVRSQCKECRSLEGKAEKVKQLQPQNVFIPEATNLNIDMSKYKARKPIGKQRSLQDHADNIAAMKPKLNK